MARLVELRTGIAVNPDYVVSLVCDHAEKKVRLTMTDGSDLAFEPYSYDSVNGLHKALLEKLGA